MSDKKLSKKETLRAVRDSLWFVIKNSPLIFIIAVIEEIIFRLLPFASAWVLSSLLSTLPRVARSSSAQHAVLLDIILLAVITLISTALTTVTDLYNGRRRIELDLQVTRRLQVAFASLPFPLYEDKRVIDSYDRAKRFASQLSSFVLDRLRGIFGAIVTFIAAIIAFWHFSPLLTVIIFLLALPTLWVEVRLQRMRERLWRDNTVTYRKAYAHEGLIDPTIIKESRLLGLTAFAIEKAQSYKRQGEVAQWKAGRKTEKYRLASQLLGAGLEAMVLIRAVQLIVAGKMPFGQFVFVQQVAGQYLGALSNLGWLVQSSDDLLFGIHEFMEIVNYPKEAPGEPVHNAGGDIVFTNVSFSYPNARKAALEKVSLKIAAGQTVAIVGENGAGKTTFVKLLMKLYDVTEGAILVGGQSLEAIKGSAWYEHIGVLFQDFQIYSDFTIRDSVWFGDIRKDRNGKEILAALKAADADEFAKALPHGLETYLGKYIDEENGTNLSGGQLQRLAIARTLFRQPDILILDEPTSAIDAKAEYKIFQSIEAARKGRTTILISHRFSTVRKADYIYVFSKGRVVEEGEHDVLMANQGLYYEMFTKQAEGYR